MKIQGKERFLRRLDRMPAVMRDEVRKALDVSAQEATDLMRRFAPVRTGRLKSSIGHRFGRAPKGTLSSAVREAKADHDLLVTMYAGGGEAYYAAFQEFGTREMAAQPFFFPAYRLARKRAKARLSRALRKGAKKAVGT